ncbi:MAG: family phosphohydrolase [Thermoleophilia bacterium]|nr:family phosphohydrolase [Thermoleophilia bacterium]
MRFIACLSSLALVLAATNTLLNPADVVRSGFLIAALAVASLAGSLTTVRITDSLSIGGAYIPLVAASVLEPRLAPLMALATLVASYPSMTLRFLNASYFVAASSAAAFAVGSLGSGAGTITTTVVAGFTFLTVNTGLFAAYEAYVWREPLRTLGGSLLASLVATGAIAVPLTALVTLTYSSIGPIAVVALLLPLAVSSYFHTLYHRKLQLTDELAEKAQILARTNLQFAAAMVKALDQRDAYTAGHSAAVAVYTRDIAREMGFDDEVIRLAHLSGLLHDIGKIGVPGRVLNKTAPLDDEEYELMKSHAAMGAEILGEVDLYADIAVLVRYHHERIDGRGYPDGIAGEAIPAISRMISVADTYSAMTTDRPYRDGMPTEKAMSILRECRGTQLDADFTDAFLRILIVADEAYQRGKQTEFEVEVAKHQALSQVEAEAVRIHAPSPAGPPKADPKPKEPVLPAAVDGELVEVELEREAA